MAPISAHGLTWAASGRIAYAADVAGTELRLTVLGSASPYPDPHNPCSGYLVTCGDTRIWVDAGTGTLAQLRRHTSLDRLTAIWISHLHADHCGDLLTAFYGARYADIRLTAPIPLYGPPGIGEKLSDFLANTIEPAFDVHELHDGHRAQFGPLTVTTRAVEHGMPAFAARFATDAAALAYSGDTAPCPALTDLATDCDLLVCEADNDAPTAVHHTPEQAGATAAAAHARRLLITHLGPWLDPEDAITRAAGEFTGRIDYAAPGRTFTASDS
ncbi:MAG TPA: MBL fold metallo-hydrolase [Pseudonocardiaceae bacterium]|jgi:ribonuclease BN (tRNA processing enzyme)